MQITPLKRYFLNGVFFKLLLVESVYLEMIFHRQISLKFSSLLFLNYTKELLG